MGCSSRSNKSINSLITKCYKQALLFNNLLLYQKKNNYEKQLMPALLISISIVITIFMALTLVDDAMSALSPSVQQINSTNTTNNDSRLYLEGQALFKAGKFDQAIVNYDKALAIAPNDTDVLVDKGIALGELKKFDQAIVDYDKALAIDPNDTRALGNKGHALLRLEKFDQAVNLLDKALAIAPNDTDVLKDKKAALEAKSGEK